MKLMTMLMKLYREKKQKFSLINKLANRWHTISKTVFLYISGTADGPKRRHDLGWKINRIS